MAKKTSITLRITGPDGTVSESSSDLESVIVGSGAGAAVKLSDPKVSNLHFMLKVEKSGQVTAIDLGSEHGTRFNDQVVKDPVTLRSGDQLVVGGSNVKVLFGEQPQAPATTSSDAITEMVKTFATPQVEERKKAPPPMPPRALAGTGRNAATLFNATGRRSRSLQDCMIAAAAIRANAELATIDVKDFRRFEQFGLRIAE